MAELLPKNAFIDAAERVAPWIHKTPLMSFRTLGDHLGCATYLKCENLQKTGSFKVRGALNSIATLSLDQKKKGVVTISAGNHAQAVAWAAGIMNVQSTVVMPMGASESKIQGARGYGAEVIVHGTAKEAFREARRLAEERDLTFLHPFDAEPVIAGQGTVGLEILAQVQEMGLQGPLTVVVPVGGGGQISGISGALSAMGSKARIFGVEPHGAAGMSQSLAAGHAVTLADVSTVADGLAAPMAGELNYAYVAQCVEDIVLVDDDAILRAMDFLLTRGKILAEPAGATGVAGLMEGWIPLDNTGTVVVVITGGNVDRGVIIDSLQSDDPFPSP